jgi:hypothetical protein
LLDASGQLRGPKVTNETQLGRASRPKTIYVTDFSIDPNDLAAGPVKSRLNTGIIRGTLDTIKGTDSSPEGQAQAIVNSMSNSIVSELQRKGFAAVRIRSRSQPSSGWIVRGRFSTVDQGDRAVRTAIGLGAGATNLNVDVIVDQVAGGQKKPILLFDTANKSGRGPSGLLMAGATKNPYAIAVKYALSGRALDTNIRKTASSIADQIDKTASGL